MSEEFDEMFLRILREAAADNGLEIGRVIKIEIDAPPRPTFCHFCKEPLADHDPGEQVKYRGKEKATLGAHQKCLDYGCFVAKKLPPEEQNDLEKKWLKTKTLADFRREAREYFDIKGTITE